MNRRREVVLDSSGFFSRHETGEDEDRLSDTSLPNCNTFIRTGDAEPLRARLFERLCHFGTAVAVAVAFYDREDLARRLALLFRRIYVLPDGLEIVRQSGKRDFSPDRASHFFVGTLWCECHVLPEKNSVRHSRCARRRPHWLPPERQHPPARQAEGLSHPQPTRRFQQFVLVTASLLYSLTGSVPVPPAATPSPGGAGTF